MNNPLTTPLPISLNTLMIIVGLGSLIVFAYTFLRSYKLKKNGLIADGVITGRDLYFPVVTFTDASGKTVVFTSILRQTLFRSQIGKKVSVIYNATNSSTAQINTFKCLWYKPLVSLSVGVLFILGGIFS